MTKNEIAYFRIGYGECRQVIIGSLREALDANDLRATITDMIQNLENDAEADHWRNIQEDFPGISREEYKAASEESCNQIKEQFYSEAGYLKPRLIKNNSDDT